MPNLLALIACRFVLGIGVGGDYVLSPIIMGEHANRADRGKALGLGFGTMWPVGGAGRGGVQAAAGFLPRPAGPRVAAGAGRRGLAGARGDVPAADHCPRRPAFSPASPRTRAKPRR